MLRGTGALGGERRDFEHRLYDEGPRDVQSLEVARRPLSDVLRVA